MSDNEEPPAKLLKASNDDDDATDFSEASLPETTEVPADNLTEPMGIAESLSMEGMEMIEERLQDSLESQEAPDGHDSQEVPDGQDSQEVAGQDNQETVEGQDSQEAAESQDSQEEWLSEDVLTDDDYNHAPETSDFQPLQDNSQSDISPDNNTEQQVPEITEPEPKESEQTVPEPMKPADVVIQKVEAPEQNIEDALNTLEGGPEKEVELADDLDAFLIKKTNGKTEELESKPNNKKEEEDDGNDTDDLLRMLGEDGIKSKKLTKTVKDMRSSTKVEPPSSDDDDDDFVFEGATTKKLELSKSLLKMPMKAEPEDMDSNGTDQSSDENTMQKMFGAQPKQTSTKVKTMRIHDTHVKSIVSIRDKPIKERIATSTPLRGPRPAHKAHTAHTAHAPRRTALHPPVQVKREPHAQTYTRQKPDRKPPPLTPAPTAPPALVIKQVKVEPEAAEDDLFQHNDEDFESDYEDVRNRQRIEKPERMDEDALSDADSHSEDGSLYDELPSSDSEDAEDWFQLDIRAEKAGDYLPLLGAKAKEMLLEEKRRVSNRLSNLKQSLAALTDSGKKQAEQVRSATMTLAELDDMLKAS